MDERFDAAFARTLRGAELSVFLSMIPEDRRALAETALELAFYAGAAFCWEFLNAANLESAS